MQVNELDNQIFGADVSTIDLDNDGYNDPIAYNSDYDFNGGISEFGSGLSTKFSKNLNIGFKIGKYLDLQKEFQILDYIKLVMINLEILIMIYFQLKIFLIHFSTHLIIFYLI